MAAAPPPPHEKENNIIEQEEPGRDESEGDSGTSPSSPRVYDVHGKAWHPMNCVAADTNEPTVAYPDEDAYQADKAIAGICASRGIPFLSFRGVSEMFQPRQQQPPMFADDTIPVLTDYLNKAKKGNLATLAWENVCGVIRRGDLATFQAMCADDPGLAARVGDPSIGTCPIHVACSYPDAFPILEWLLTLSSTDVNAVSKTGRTPLAYAILQVNPQAVEALLQPQHKCDTSTLNPNVFPPYIENGRVPAEALERMFRVMDLLPPAVTAKFDVRWTMLYNLKHAKSENVRCVVCIDAAPDTIVFPCGHKVVCRACSARLQTDPINSYICVVCRRPIEGVYIESEDRMQEQQQQQQQ